MCSCEQGADSSQARVCGSRVPKHGHMRGICIARQVRPESSSDAWSDRGGVGRLPSAQDGAERGTAWQATAGLNCPAWPAALCQGQRGACDSRYIRALAAVKFAAKSAPELGEVQLGVVTLAADGIRCQPAIQDVWVLTMLLTYSCSTTPACYGGEQCHPAGKSVSDVKLHS